MTAPLSAPLRLECGRLPDGVSHVHHHFAPVPHAYVLIDLSSTAAGNEDDFVRTQAGLREQVADDVTWRMALFTNAHGELVDLLSHSSGPASCDLSQAAVREQVDALPPLVVPLGVEFNLWWCLDHADFQAARARGGPVHAEHELQKVCTWLPAEESGQASAARTIAAGLWPGQDAGSAARDRLLRSPESRHQRTAARISMEGGLHLVLQISDQVLDTAMALASEITDLVSLPGECQLGSHLALLDRLEETMVRRVDGHHGSFANDVIPYAQRRRDEYRRTAANLRACSTDLHTNATQVAAVLARSIGQAIAECRWHYPAEQGGAAAASLLHVLGLALFPELATALQEPEVPADIRRALEGAADAPEDTPLQRYLKAVGKAGTWLGRGSTFLRRSTEALEAVVQSLDDESTQVVTIAANVRTVMWFVERGNWITGPSTTRVRVEMPIVVSGDLSFRVVASWLRSAGPELERFGNALKVLNCITTVEQLNRDPSFRNWVSTGRSFAEVATMNSRVRSQICEAIGIEVGTLQLALVGVGIFVDAWKAADAFAQGNNVACLGYLLGACGGFLGLFAVPGVGYLAATLVVAGAVVVAISLDDDEEWIVETFNTDGEDHPAGWTRGDAAASEVDHYDRELGRRTQLAGFRGALDDCGVPA